jgi:hypothetical protein
MKHETWNMKHENNKKSVSNTHITQHKQSLTFHYAIQWFVRFVRGYT